MATDPNQNIIHHSPTTTMKAIRTTSLLLALLLPLGTTTAHADEQAARKNPHVALAELADSKYAAYIGMSVNHAPNRHQPFFGVFVSGDGLALVNLGSLARKQTPSVMAAGRTPLKFGTVLGIFPELELALMQFNHRPKVWLKFAATEPEVGETVALLPVKAQDPWHAVIPPVAGPVMLKRSGTSANLTVGRFTRILSLGASITPAQRAALTPGSFAINGRGELVAFMGGTQVNPGQTLVFLIPVGDLADQVGRLAKAGKTIPFPLSPEDNLIDLVLLDDDFRAMHLAIQGRNRAAAQRSLQTLLKRYPASLNLKILAVSFELALIDPATPLLGLAAIQPDPAASKADQIAIMEARAKIMLTMGDDAGGIRELEAAIQPGVCPPDFPRHRTMLAEIHTNAGSFEKAEALYRQAYPFSSDSIDVVAGFEEVLLKLGKFDEADPVTERVYELSEVYRTR